MAATRDKLLSELAQKKDKKGFLAALESYPQSEDLTIGYDIYFLNPFKRSILIEAVAEHLDAECCQALMNRSGFWNTLNALNGQQNPTCHGLRELCSYQSFDLISGMFHKFHVGFQFREGKDSYSKYIVTNPHLTDEQKMDLIELTNTIYAIRNNPREFVLNHPKNFLKFYQDHRPPFLLIPKLKLLKETPDMTREQKEALKKKNKAKEVAYKLREAEYKQWEDYVDPLIQGLRVLPTTSESSVLDEKVVDFKIYDELALYDMRRGHHSSAFSLWGQLLARKFPAIEVAPACIDFLLHHPENFKNVLSKGQCKFMGLMLAMNNLEYAELHIPGYNPNIARASTSPSVMSTPPPLHSDSKEEKRGGGELDESEAKNSAETEIKSWWNSEAYIPLKEKFTEALMTSLQIMIRECIESIPSSGVEAKFFKPSISLTDRAHIMGALKEIEKLASEKPKNFLFKIVGICSTYQPILNNSIEINRKSLYPSYILKSIQEAAITLIQMELKTELLPITALSNELYDMQKAAIASEKREAELKPPPSPS